MLAVARPEYVVPPIVTEPKVNATESVTDNAPTVDDVAKAEMLFEVLVKLTLPEPEITTP